MQLSHFLILVTESSNMAKNSLRILKDVLLHPKKLSTLAECHIQMLSLKDRRRSAVSIAAKIEEVGVSLLAIRPYAALYIKCVCMAVTLGGSLL